MWLDGFKKWRDALLAGELLDALRDLIVFEPIDDLAPLAQHQRHHDVGEALTMCVGLCLFDFREVDDLPAQARKLVEQRLFYVLAFVQLDVRWQRGLNALILTQHRCSSGSVLASITSPP